MIPFVDIFKRWQLEQKGLSSGKKRKQNDEDSLANNLDDSIYMRAAVFVGFAICVIIMTIQMAQMEIYSVRPLIKVIEITLLVAALITVFILNHREKLPKTRLLLLTFGGLGLQTLLTCIAITSVHKSGYHPSYAILFTPFVLVPMIHSILLGRWLGIFSSVYMALITGFLSPSAVSQQAFLIAMLSGLTSVYFTRGLLKRSQILNAGVFSGITALVAAWALEVIPILDSYEVISTKDRLIQSGIVLGIGCFSGLFVGGIMPALENIFRITTNMTWLELSDLNHKLLRRMQLEAPGTFHHSMVVATLSEAAAESIGANAPMCRVASYFHDIGKIEKPEYFIENQGDENPHDNLTPNMSALVIIAHVKDGIDLAVRHKLNQAIINVIKEHHGNSLVYYFYRKALDARNAALQEVEEGNKNEEDVPEVSEKGFRYPGPSPRTKESGIIALADSIESASRSMKKVTPQKIQSVIDEIVNNRIKDGQLDQCPLTFQELNTIKATFASTLRSMLHSRIDYPKEGENRDSSGGKKSKDETNHKSSSPRTIAAERD